MQVLVEETKLYADYSHFTDAKESGFLFSEPTIFHSQLSILLSELMVRFQIKKIDN